TESAANNKAVSRAKAKGLMQLIDSTASDMGVRNVFNPRENILGGTKYFAQMLRQYSGDVKLALAAYNAGPQNVAKYKGVPPFEETKNYINKVLGYLDHFKESEQ
ncbi:MAG: lytic transglycosylase domain-containing protein, partial [Bacteroidota bacterium]